MRVTSLTLLLTSLALAACSADNSCDTVCGSGDAGSTTGGTKTDETDDATDTGGVLPDLGDDDDTTGSSGDSTGDTGDTGTDTGGVCTEDCEPMVSVPAGSFAMGCNDAIDQSCANNEKPAHTVELDAFEIDVYEVTVERYLQCVADGACTEPDLGAACNAADPDRGDHPINCVDWSQAVDFCDWVGKRLPTEAEWELAARSDDGRIYPWGNAATCDHAVMYEDAMGSCGTTGTLPVGSRPAGASAIGTLDMAGNVAEWVGDWYDSGYYDQSPTQNPQGPADGMYRVVRGGSSDDLPAYVRSTHRNRFNPILRFQLVGFRCASSL